MVVRFSGNHGSFHVFSGASRKLGISTLFPISFSLFDKENNDVRGKGEGLADISVVFELSSFPIEFPNISSKPHGKNSLSLVITGMLRPITVNYRIIYGHILVVLFKKIGASFVDSICYVHLAYTYK